MKSTGEFFKVVLNFELRTGEFQMNTHKLLKLFGIFYVVVLLCGPSIVAAADKAPEAAVVKEAAEAAGAMEAVNINTASVDALSKIPGVGPKVGEAIAAYRETNGAFKSIADLANVDGIDAALLEKIKPFLSM